MVARTQLVAITLLLAACNWVADGPARIEHLYPTPDVAEVQEENLTDPTDTGYAGEVDLNQPDGITPDIQINDFWGYYVVEMKLPATMEFFPGSPPYDMLITNLFVASWSDDGLEWEYCHQDAAIASSGLGETEMLADTEKAIGQQLIPFQEAPGVGIPDQKVAWTWGLQGMADPLTDPLPTDAEDPLVWDQDEDGNPGVTVQVIQPEGYRYLVRRAVWHFLPPVRLEDGDRLEGTLTFDIDEGAVGYDGHSSLATLIPIVPTDDPGTYRMVRTAEYYSCEQLLAAYPDIF